MGLTVITGALLEKILSLPSVVLNGMPSKSGSLFLSYFAYSKVALYTSLNLSTLAN
jgi:ABC-type thiamin/hydroxymethylpyrimidine transport system permease subunit